MTPVPGPTTPLSEESGLGWSPFARRYSGIRDCFLFLEVLRWFTSPRSPPHPMYSGTDDRALSRPGFPIRKSPDQSLLAASRGLSQLATSFIDFQCQGIPRAPSVTCPFASTSGRPRESCRRSPTGSVGRSRLHSRFSCQRAAHTMRHAHQPIFC